MTLVFESPVIPLHTDADGVIRVANTRVRLDTVVYAFNQGYTAEDIISQYPSLQLADVYAVISYYLNNRTEVDEYVRRREVDAAKIRQEIESRPDYQEFTSVVIWLLETVKYWFVMRAFDFQVSFFALMLMNGVVNLMTTLPAAPGYVGTFDAPGIAVLELYGVPKEIATAYTLVLHAALWLPITMVGAYYMIRAGMRWSTFGKAVEVHEKEVPVN